MNIINFIKKYIAQKAPTITSPQIDAAQHNKVDRDLLRSFGVIQSDLRLALQNQSLIQYERSNLYQTLDRSLVHPLMSAATGMFADVATNFNRINGATVWCETESKEYKYQIDKLLDIINIEENIYDWAWQCVVGTTKISLLDGTTPTIKEIVDNKEKYIGKNIYSINPETKMLEVDEITNAIKTKQNAEIIRVWLDNNQYIDCTPDHKFMLRDGSFEEAQYLISGESLMPLYEDTNKNKYTKIYNPGKNKWINKINLILTKEYLIKKHIEEQKTVTEIVRESGCGMTAVRNTLKKFNIPIHDWIVEKAEAVLNKEFLQEQYINKKHTLQEISNIVNYNIFTIVKYLKKYNIPVRNISEAKKGKSVNTKFANKITKEFLEEHYVNQKLSSKKIGILLGCDETVIRRYLKKYSIFVRGKNETQKGRKCSEESKLKMSLAKKGKNLGENSPNWKGGISPLTDLIRHSNEYELWVNNVFKRDNYKCQDCGEKGYVEAHHIKEFSVIFQEFLKEYNQFSPIEDKETLIRLAVSYKPFWETSNGKTVCLKCHDTNHKKILNHKVVKIEKLNYKEDVYDLTIKKNHNFPTEAGVFIHNCATFGDLFCDVFGEPGVGIVSINDDRHPIDISRIDYNGRLIGFYETPQGYNVSDTRELLPPWALVHFKLLGSRRRRLSGSTGNEQYSEFRTISIMTPDARRLTNKYGTSVLTDALPTWKRLRLAEDSVMMARITRGILRYIYKVVIDKGNNNSDSVLELLDGYITELKRARALDTTTGNYQDRFNAPAGMEDIILPVWGEAANLDIEKIGGEVDIKWIADIDALQAQLSTALKVPLPLLAGYADKAGGFEQGNALEKLDIRFARQARRIQRSLINGITRLVQIHLAYQGINPDLSLFKIKMSETSTAEETEVVNSLNTSVDVAQKVMQLYDDALSPDLDKKQLIDILNQKILKLTDVELDKLILKGNKDAFKPVTEEPLPNEPNPFKEAKEKEEKKEELNEEVMIHGSADLKSALPLDKREVEKVNEKKEKVKVFIYENKDWNSKWKGKKVTIKEIKKKGIK